MDKRLIGLLAAVLALIGAMAFKDRLLTPAPVRAQSAPGSFDAPAAMARLARILGPSVPHWVDSPANDAVRDRLVAELRAIGLSPRIQDRFTCNPNARSRNIGCARVRNVVATVGPATGRHLLLVSHYDSTPVGPGASDDGIGVAAMLGVAVELVRRPPARPVTLLFDEGEEAGLIGARAFIDADPVAPRVTDAINLEARGVEGPALMFETSRPNGRAIAMYRAGADRPAANSLSADFYALIPNSTDVDVLKARGWTILNFAVIGNETRYHSAGDDLAALDPRSLQHMGDQLLGTVRAFDAPAQATPTGERVYADVLGLMLVDLPVAVAAVLLATLLAGASLLLLRRRRGILVALGAILAALAASALLAAAAQGIVSAIRPGDYWRGHPNLVALAIDLSALAGAMLALRLVARRSDPKRLRIAFWWLFLVLGAVFSALVPGAMIYFLVPPAIVLAAIALRRGERAAAWIAALALFATLAPLHALSGILLGYGSGWMLALVAALILLPFVIELHPATLRRPRPALLLAFGAALAAWSAVAIAPASSPDRQRTFAIEHVTDEAGRARWMVVTDGAPLPAAFAGFAPGMRVPWSTRQRWSAAAPPLAAPPRASIDGLRSRPVAGGRLVSFRLRSGGADAVSLRLAPGAALVAARMNGSTARFGAGRPSDHYQLHCRGRACDGAPVTLLLPGGTPRTALLVGLRAGLPPSAAALVTARPPLSRPQYTPDQTVALTAVRL